MLKKIINGYHRTQAMRLKQARGIALQNRDKEMKIA